ncbi:MAG: transcription-repair coupling factor [Magnetococcales bacterium]|nr:transcription-repair coupling factor [Magnetococcales bacterium]
MERHKIKQADWLPTALWRQMQDGVGRWVAVAHWPGAALAWCAVQMAEQFSGPLVVVVPSNIRVDSLYRELLFFTADQQRSMALLPFPGWGVMPGERLSPDPARVGARLATLFRLTQMHGVTAVTAGDGSGRTCAIVITTPAALMQRLMPAAVLAQNGFSVAVGDQIDLPALRRFLIETGYHPVSQVQEAGEFAVRGGIIDLFPPTQAEAVRIELFGDEVETIRRFDPVSQRSRDNMPRLHALPVCEVILEPTTIETFRTHYYNRLMGQAGDDNFYQHLLRGEKMPGMEHLLPLFYAHTDTFFDYLPTQAAFLIDSGVMAACADWQQEMVRSEVPVPELYLSMEEMTRRWHNWPGLTLDHDDDTPYQAISCEATPCFHSEQRDGHGSIMATVATTIRQWQQQRYRVAIVVRTIGQQQRLHELLADQRLPTMELPSWQAVLQWHGGDGHVAMVVGDVPRGLIHADSHLVLLTEEDIFGARLRQRQTDRRYLDQLLASFAALNETDLVVHGDYGIGRYAGLHTLTVGDQINDFMLVVYADEDKLYVPVDQLDRVSKYSSGVAGAEVALDKLGSTRWKRTRQRVRRDILAMAQEMVRLQAHRQMRHGFAFSPPDMLYQEFAASFPFEETPDQSQAIEAVLADMSSDKPMDRLVCGDVGFGKTEVALRAAFRAAIDGKQVAVLVPTTILAQQHYETFSKRMESFPLRIDLLSRFRTPKQHQQTLAAMAAGQVDVVIGTHRLLQKDVTFSHLGLLIIDEEQRFGVTHKERIKQLRATVDILTLTATPIPRTLHLAMSGVRDISIIASPPPDRSAIRTITTQYDKQLIREAILREIYRGGQVFYLFNRVDEIERQANLLVELVPEAKIGVAHGQMSESTLEKIIFSFYRQQFNVLVCTTIIENGIDIPSANTIIIHRADQFGLAQLHQLRGRVGRSKQHAYAYLLLPTHSSHMTRDAQRRLEAIETFAELGSGFMLATQDMEIRGAGNILGEAQSGQIREVGFDLYNQMLQEAIQLLHDNPDADINQLAQSSQESAPATQERLNPTIQLHISSYIPDSYVSDVHQRLTLYKRISGLTDAAELNEMRLELLDRFGPLPDSVLLLLQAVALKQLCQRLRIVRVEAGPKGGVIQFDSQPRINTLAMVKLLQQSGGKVQFDASQSTLTLRQRDWNEPAARLSELTTTLQQLVEPD